MSKRIAESVLIRTSIFWRNSTPNTGNVILSKPYPLHSLADLTIGE